MKPSSRSTINTTKSRHTDNDASQISSRFSLASWLGMCMGLRKKQQQSIKTKSKSRTRSKPKSKPKKFEHGWLSPNFGCDDSPPVSPDSARSSFSTLVLEEPPMLRLSEKRAVLS